MTTRTTSLTPAAFLAGFPPAARAMAERVRKVVLASIPDVVEKVLPGWGALGYRTADAGHICALFPYASEVRLYFNHGFDLPDGQGVEFGDTKLTRYAIFRRAADVKKKTLAPMVLQAYATTSQRREFRRAASRPKLRRR